MANFCYLVGDKATRKCAVIDPAFEPGKILKAASEKGLTITHVINTHGHFDHTSANAAILEATGACLCIHEADAHAVSGIFQRVVSRFAGGKVSPPPDRKLKDNENIRVGKIGLSVIHTPGHTPGSICIYTPGHVFTGDTLFVGSIGRTDLPGGSHKAMLKSIRERLYTLPGNTIVWPGHDYGPSPSSTIRHERETNPFT